MATDMSQLIIGFAERHHDMPEYLLNNGGWGWDDYDGVRYAFLHVTAGLHAVAAHILQARYAMGAPPTLAQQALADHRRAFRDMESLLVGVPDSVIDQPPSDEEWSIRTIVLHVHKVERYFLTAILNALEGVEPHEPDDEEVAARVGEPVHLPADLSLRNTWAAYARLHGLVQETLKVLSHEQLHTLSAMWESRPLPVLFRMHRFAAHLREHSNQLEKTLRSLGRAPEEAKMLVRQMYAGLAEMEGALIGREDVGEPAIQFTANELEARIETLELALVQIERFLVAVRDEDITTVNAMLAENPRIAQTVMDDGLSALLYSHYRSRGDLVRSFLGSGLYLTIFEAAAVGDAARVGRILTWEPNLVNEFSRDGFTPLHLACYFGHHEAARVLLERGATIEAVSRNPSQLRAIHAAVASRIVEVVRSLVAAGADVNVRQDGDFTPLMAALENGDSEIEAILRGAGAKS